MNQPFLRAAAIGKAIFLAALAGSMTSPNAAAADVRRDATVEAVEKVMPSVVNISTETLAEAHDPIAELFSEFFGPYYRRRPNAQKSLGSGVIIDEEGYVLTNLHVVRRANRITVTLWDGREYEARSVIGTPGSDVALLQISRKENETFKAVKLAADDDLLLGETVLALGNPFGLGGSVSRGILSSKTRRPPVENQPLELADWLQTDAAINPGNSGGPLVNLRAELIGLNVAIFREGEGIGFAIPAKRISEALSSIFTPENLRGLWFGGRFVGKTNGVEAVKIERGSPAEKAGLREGDRILQVEGRRVANAFEANRELIAAAEKTPISLQIERGGKARTVTVKLTPETEVFNAALVRQRMGATLQELTPELARGFGLSHAEGLLVAGVDKGGPAAQANLRRGQIVQSIDGAAVTEIKEAARILHAKRAGDAVRLGLVVQETRGRFIQLYQTEAEVQLR